MTLDYHPLAKDMVELLLLYIVLPTYRELNPETLALFIRQIQFDRSVFSKLKSAPPKRAAS